jgi:hypothetical protein
MPDYLGIHQRARESATQQFDFSDKIREFAKLKQYKSALDAEKDKMKAEADQLKFDNGIKSATLKFNAIKTAMDVAPNDPKLASAMVKEFGLKLDYSGDDTGKTATLDLGGTKISGSPKNVGLASDFMARGIAAGEDPRMLGAKAIQLYGLKEVSVDKSDKDKENKPDRMLAKDVADAEFTLLGDKGKDPATAQPTINQYNAIADGDSFYRFNPGAGQAEKVQLPKTPDGKQITMKDVRAFAEEKGISFEKSVDELYRRLGYKGFFDDMIETIVNPLGQAGGK